MSLESQLSPVQIPKNANVLAVCGMEQNRSPKLVEILEEHGYQNVGFVGVMLWQIKNAQVKADWADYIVTLDPQVARKLSERYTLKPKQILIELNVPEYVGKDDTGNRRLREPKEIYEDIRQQIAPYLSD